MIAIPFAILHKGAVQRVHCSCTRVHRVQSTSAVHRSTVHIARTLIYRCTALRTFHSCTRCSVHSVHYQYNCHGRMPSDACQHGRHFWHGACFINLACFTSHGHWQAWIEASISIAWCLAWISACARHWHVPTGMLITAACPHCMAQNSMATVMA